MHKTKKFYVYVSMVCCVALYMLLISCVPVYAFKPLMVLDASKSYIYFCSDGAIAMNISHDGIVTQPDRITKYENGKIEYTWRGKTTASINMSRGFFSLNYALDEGDAIEPDLRIWNPVILIKVCIAAKDTRGE